MISDYNLAFLSTAKLELNLQFQVIHQWPSLKYPEMAVLKLVGVMAVFFLFGLLPWIDNYAHMFGFIFGFLVSYAIMPFVTFGLYDRRRKAGFEI